MVDQTSFPRRWSSLLFVAAVLVPVTLFQPYRNGPPIRSDGEGYHVWTRLLLEGDLSFQRYEKVQGIFRVDPSGDKFAAALGDMTPRWRQAVGVAGLAATVVTVHFMIAYWRGGLPCQDIPAARYWTYCLRSVGLGAVAALAGPLQSVIAARAAGTGKRTDQASPALTMAKN